MSPITELPPGGFGAAITPQEWTKYVLTHLYFQSVVLASGATRIDTVFRQVHVPRVKTDGSAGWYSEVETITAGEPTGDELLLTPKKVAAPLGQLLSLGATAPRRPDREGRVADRSPS